jgi:hypothetical protein
MDFLFVFWIGALFAMITIVLSYGRRMDKQEFTVAQGITVGDVVREEIDAALRLGSKIAASARPHLASMVALARSRASRFFFYLSRRIDSNIYGKQEISYGKTASFFMKQIREFKNDLSRDEIR